MNWDNWAPVKVATAATVIAGVSFGSFLFLDERHAKAAEFNELKRYTIYSLKEAELDTTTARLEILFNIPVDERRDWQVREIQRLERRVQAMQTKLNTEILE